MPFKVPNHIWNKVEEVLSSISDEVGTEHLSSGYILKYEGWSASCFGLGYPIESEEECKAYAEEESSTILETDWIPEMKKHSYELIDGGYREGGIYGITWGLFHKETKGVS